jgi:Tfp pilus assembly pilus retraction ATPase PilT
MGLLVFGTLHTNNAPKTVDRIIDAFPADEQNQIRRTTNELEAGGSKLTTDIVIKQVTEPIVIEVPAAEDVTDINDLI